MNASTAARSAATVIRPRTSQSPAHSPSFATALAQRVRFAGGEVPLWSLVTPLVLLMALGTAFAAAAVTRGADRVEARVSPDLTAPASESGSTLASAAPPLTTPSPLVPSTPSDEPAKPLSLLERAELGDGVALKALADKPQSELVLQEALALSLGRSVEQKRKAQALRKRVEHDPGLIKDPEVLTQLRRYCDDPETARDALAAIANVPGPISADLIYEVWTATTTRTAASDLAHALIYSKEVRAKASKPLAIALDLREAQSCEQNQAILARASSEGDRRAFHLLNKLTRKYGCGPAKRQDCYACLRDGNDLEAAMKAVKARREPRPFGS